MGDAFSVPLSSLAKKQYHPFDTVQSGPVEIYLERAPQRETSVDRK